MRILSGNEILKHYIDGSVVTIGNFDGVHRGHVELLRRLQAQSSLLGLPSVVITFEPHPLKYLAPDAAPPLITTFEQKAALIAATGIDVLVVIEFNQAFSEIEADSFVRDLLCKALGMRHIIIGHDYAFGRGRQGNYETLSRLGVELNFTLEDLEPVGTGNSVFSSSLVRRMISEGDVNQAASILGRYHVISGLVVHGREIGQKLGFPTANIIPLNQMIPADGVYAVMVAVGNERFQGACNIGTNPTFDGKDRTIEVFLLNFSGTLYDREIAICFVQRLRDVQKFNGAATLIAAIEHDVAATRTLLAAHDPGMVIPLFSTMVTGEAA